jgi:hypothetical protein
MLKVKVPLIFLGTQGFSARREGRYIIRGMVTVKMSPNESIAGHKG